MPIPILVACTRLECSGHPIATTSTYWLLWEVKVRKFCSTKESCNIKKSNILSMQKHKNIIRTCYLTIFHGLGIIPRNYMYLMIVHGLASIFGGEWWWWRLNVTCIIYRSRWRLSFLLLLRDDFLEFFL